MKRGNTTAANTYVGPLGELVVDTGLRTVRVQDGVTAGGMSTLATNVQLQALGTYANATFGTSSYGNANVALHLLTSSIIGNINANVTAANAAITSLTSNAATQATLINAINANVTAANAAITSLTSNAAIQASLLDTLTGNAATQAQVLDTLTSNAATQATSLTTLLSNAATQQTSLTDLVANAVVQAQAIANAAGTYGNANVAAYLPTYSGNIGNIVTTSNVITSGYFVGNGALLTGLTSASYDLIRTDTFVLDIPNPTPPETRWANITLNNECGQLEFQRVSGASNYNYLTYTLDGSNPLTSNTAISVYLPNGTSQRINVLGGSVLKTTPTGGDNGAGAVLTFYQYRAYYVNSYNNANVQSYIGANIGTLHTNAATQATSINSITANLGAYQTYGNLTFSTVANAATQASSITTLQTQVYANANVAEYLPTYSGNVRAEYLIMSFGGIITTGASPAPSISGFSSISTAGNAVNEGNISASGNLVANRGAYITGNVTAGNLTITGNIAQPNRGFGNGPGTNLYITAGHTQGCSIPGGNTIISGGLGYNGIAWNGGNVTLRTGDYYSKQWNFDYAGNLTLPTTANSDTSIGTAFNTNPPGHTVTLKHNGGVSGGSGGELKFDYGNAQIKVVKDAGTTQTWTFGTDGTTAFPNSLILAPVSQSITMQSDQYSQLMWENANVTVAPNMAINSNFYVAQNSATLDIGYRDGSSTQLIKSWLWSVDGGMSFPDTTTQYTAFSNAAVATYLSNYDGGINFTASPAVITGLGNISSANFTFGNGVNILSTVVTGTYGNTQVAAYIPINPTVTALQANIGAYYTFANANAATQATSINSINANIGAYYTFANANLATQTTNINTINANLGAYQTYANATFSTSTYSNTQANALLSSNTVSTISTTGNITTIANVVAPRYLFANGVNILSTVVGTYGNTEANALLSGNVTVGNLITTGNLYGNVVGTTGVYSGNVSINGVTTLAGNLGVNGSQVTIFDSILGLHTYANLTPWAADDGRDIGIRMHYYNAADKHAFLGLENTTKSLQFIVDATETSSNVTGTFGNAQMGSMLLSNTTTSTTTTTGALIVAGGVGFAGNITAGGNITQQSAYYETYGNISNSGGNLTCNFNLGTTFYAALTANVTANFTNVNAIASTVSGATIIVDQGATAYRVANVQVNGVNQTVKWVSATTGAGTASNTDVMSFSLINLGGGVYRVLGQISNYG